MVKFVVLNRLWNLYCYVICKYILLKILLEGNLIYGFKWYDYVFVKRFKLFIKKYIIFRYFYKLIYRVDFGLCVYWWYNILLVFKYIYNFKWYL